MEYSLADFIGRFTDTERVELFEALNALPPLSAGGPWIAGGAVRRSLMGETLASDIDVFFASRKQLHSFKEEILKRGGRLVSENELNTTFELELLGRKVPVQCVHVALFPTATAVIDSFDFTITQFATDGRSLWCGEYSLWDLARKRLALHRLTFGVSTLRRTIKYANQGFTACAGVLADILERTVADPSTIHRDIKYID